MPNIIKEHRLVDNNKRALLKYVFMSDGTQEANTVLVDVSSLRFALNTNGQIMTNNVNSRSSYSTAIKRITGNFTVTGNAYVKLQWHGATNSEIFVAGTGPADLNFDYNGDNAVISNNEASSNGDILISTSNVRAGDVFTLLLDLKKSPSDYDQGQTADPTSFNRGPAAP